MTKKNFRENWEQVFINYNDAAVQLLSKVHQIH